MPLRKTSEIYTAPVIQGAGHAATAVPSDNAANDATARISLGIWVGLGGDLHVVFAETGAPGVTIPNVQSGTLLPFRAVRIGASNTSAQNIIFLYGIK